MWFSRISMFMAHILNILWCELCCLCTTFRHQSSGNWCSAMWCWGADPRGHGITWDWAWWKDLPHQVHSKPQRPLSGTVQSTWRKDSAYCQKFVQSMLLTGLPINLEIFTVKFNIYGTCCLVPRSHPQKEGKGSGDLGGVSWFDRLWVRTHRLGCAWTKCGPDWPLRLCRWFKFV